jgi:hypothetical protein
MVELPLTEVHSRPDIYAYLFDNMAFTASVLRARKESIYQIWREPGEEGDIILDDRTGVVLRARNVLREPGRWVYYTYGSYDLGLFKVWGRSVIIVVYEEREGALWTQARVYAKLEGIVLEQGAKLLGLIEKTIRNRAFLFIDVATRVSEMAASEPQKLVESVEGSAEVDPAALNEFKQKFVK